MLPMIKLGGLVARTLTKPLAKQVKTRAKVTPWLNGVCLRLGQRQHQLSMKLHMGFRGIANYTIKELPNDQAVEQGADLIGEVIIFSVALGAASLEYSRSSAQTREKQRIENAQRQQEERELEARFEYLETQVRWLEDRLGAVVAILEDDLKAQGKQQPKEAKVEPTLAEVKGSARAAARRHHSHNVHVGFDIDDKAAQSLSASLSSAVSGSYNAIVGLFK